MMSTNGYTPNSIAPILQGIEKALQNATITSLQSGYLTKNVAGNSNVSLSTEEQAKSVIEFTGVLTGNINVTVGDNKEGYRWIVKNSTTGAYTLTVKTTSGTGVAVPQTTTPWEVYSDTANIVSRNGTSGAVVPLLNGANTWSAKQTFSSGFAAIGFSAISSVAQTFTSGVTTAVACATEVFDSHGWYNTTTSRFTPQLAGKYLVVGGVQFLKGGAGETTILSVSKNGTEVGKLGCQSSVGTEAIQLSGSCIVVLNGTTDYIELVANVSATDDSVPGVANQNVYFGATYIGT